MTDPSGFGSGARLTFHGPLSAERADRLAADLAAGRPANVVDYGCGWGELLLRVLEAAPQANGVGIDLHGPDIARGRENARKRGLSGRVSFIEGPATDHASPADAVISCGAYQAFGTIPEALRALRALVKPAGLLLFGAEIWDRTPTEEQLASMWPGTTVGDCLYLPDLVDAARAEGFRPLRVQTATRGEWEEFESGFAAGAKNGCWPTRTTPRPIRSGPSLTSIGRYGCAGTATCWATPTSPSACPDPEPSARTWRCDSDCQCRSGTRGRPALRSGTATA